MAVNGWYPDPGGARWRFRYWDGSAWSEETTTDPASPPPAGVAAPAKARKGWLIALGVLVVIVGVVVALVLRGTGGRTGEEPTVRADTVSSTPTVSASPKTATPTPTPSSDTASQASPCPTTLKTGNTTQVDGKLMADTLSADTIPGWALGPMWLAPAYDVHAQTDEIYPGWMSNIAVGLLSNSDGFVDISTSAGQLMDCFASSGYYQAFTGREDIIPGEQVTISGHAAWRIESNIYVSGQRVPGDVADIIVVDLGSDKDHLGLFFSSYSIGDDARGAKVDAAIASLAVA
ncbi:MAG: DUF2510 domain-containing protein [Propionibacteriaceae bacterium]|nr:DUF2510 domain-containing protein [Propionibacteriaceae bacterium]